MCGSWGFWLAKKSFIGVFSETPVQTLSRLQITEPDRLPLPFDALSAILLQNPTKRTTAPQAEATVMAMVVRMIAFG